MPKKRNNTNTATNKRKKKNPNTTPQDKHKYSAFTAAQDLKYNNYRNRKAAKGEKALPKREWYNKVYKSKKD